MSVPETIADRSPGGAAPLPRLPMGPFVRTLFAALNDQKIPWAVARNHEGLPDYTRNDIDIIIRAADLARARRIVRDAAAKHGWVNLGEVDKYHYHSIWLASPDEDRQFLLIDLYTGFSDMGFDFADLELGLATRRPYVESVMVVPPGFAAATVIMKELLPHSILKESARANVQRGARDDEANFRQALERRLGPDLCSKLLDACKNADWEAAAALSPQLRGAVRRFSASNLLHAIGFLAMQVCHHLRFSPLSACIALIGPDGCGKTTIAQGLAQELFKRPYRLVRHMKTDFDILPKLGQFKRWGAKLLGRKPAAAPPPAPGTKHMGMMPPNPLWRSVFYATWYAIDLFLGRLKLRRMRAHWALVIFDRYYYDYYYQRGNRRLPRWYLDFLSILVPKPDLLLYLDRDAEQIYAQKPELDLGEIKLQQQRIRDLIKNKPFARIVDARGGVENTVRLAAAQVLDHQLSLARRVHGT